MKRWLTNPFVIDELDLKLKISALIGDNDAVLSSYISGWPGYSII